MLPIIAYKLANPRWTSDIRWNKTHMSTVRQQNIQPNFLPTKSRESINFKLRILEHGTPKSFSALWNLTLKYFANYVMKICIFKRNKTKKSEWKRRENSVETIQPRQYHDGFDGGIKWLQYNVQNTIISFNLLSIFYMNNTSDEYTIHTSEWIWAP